MSKPKHIFEHDAVVQSFASYGKREKENDSHLFIKRGEFFSFTQSVSECKRWEMAREINDCFVWPSSLAHSKWKQKKNFEIIDFNIYVYVLGSYIWSRLFIFTTTESHSKPNYIVKSMLSRYVSFSFSSSRCSFSFIFPFVSSRQFGHYFWKLNKPISN